MKLLNKLDDSLAQRKERNVELSYQMQRHAIERAYDHEEEKIQKQSAQGRSKLQIKDIVAFVQPTTLHANIDDQ